MARKYKKNRKSYKGQSQDDRSYTSYLNHRQEWINKGYSLTEKLSKEEFLDYKEKAKDAGKKNFVREFVKDERMYTPEFARNFVKKARAYGDAEVSKKDVLSTDERKKMFEYFINEFYNGDYAKGREEFEALY